MSEQAVVLTQKATVAELPTGNYGPVVQITFRTPRGFIGVVNVPQSSYTAESARAAVDGHAAELDAI